MLFRNKFIIQLKIIKINNLYNNKYKVKQIDLWRDKFKFKTNIKNYECSQEYNFYNEPITIKKFIRQSSYILNLFIIFIMNKFRNYQDKKQYFKNSK